MSKIYLSPRNSSVKKLGRFWIKLENKIKSYPPGACPLTVQLSLLNLSINQTCGKCVPCRDGLPQLAALLQKILDGDADMDILNEMTIERADELDTMADNGIMLEKAALDSGDQSSARIMQLSVDFASGQPSDLSDLPDLEINDPETAYVIKRTMLAAQCIDDLPEIPADSVMLHRFTPVL